MDGPRMECPEIRRVIVTNGIATWTSGAGGGLPAEGSRNEAMWAPRPVATVDEPRYRHCGYLDRALELEQLHRTIEESVKGLSVLNFDAIAFRGMSGALVAPILAYQMKKTLLMVRKESDKDNHSHLMVEGNAAARRYVIVDDFVCSGNTIRRIYHAVSEFCSAECVGIWQYNYRAFKELSAIMPIMTQSTPGMKP